LNIRGERRMKKKAILAVIFVVLYTFSAIGAILASETVFAAVSATIDVNPGTLNLKSKGNWITAHIELPEGYNAADINVSTVMLNDTVLAEGDPEHDGVSGLIVKFNRTAVSALVLSKGVKFGSVTLTITGKFNDGTAFGGSDIIKVRMPGDMNCDGKVDVRDIALAALAFGSHLGQNRWNSVADENDDGKVDAHDIRIIAQNFGKVYT
jgi:hypothetical protein